MSRVAQRVRRPRPGVPLAGLVERGRRDRWPLALTAAVLALTAFLAVVTPRLVDRTADDAVRTTVRDAGVLADTVVTQPFDDVRFGPQGPPRGSAEETVALAEQLDDGLPPELAPVLGPPVAAVVSPVLRTAVPLPRELGPLGVRLAWSWAGGAPGVRWTSGAAPGPPADTPAGPAGVPVEIGLSEASAGTIGASVGDHLPARTRAGNPVDLVVTGVFRPQDAGDPVWRSAPGLLAARTAGSGPTTQTTVSGLVSDESLPAARLALPSGDLERTVTFPALPEALDADSADVVSGAVAAVQATPSSLGIAPEPRVTSRLGLLLLRGQQQLRSAQAQAAVVVAGVVAAAALTLLLTAQLLVRRRATVLTTLRARGASLAAVGAQLAVESALVTAVGVGLGMLAGGLLVPGATAVGLLAPVLLAGLVAVPASGVLVAARSTGGRRVPANRQQRRRALRDRQLRRAAVEVAVLLLAVTMIATLRLRGVLASAADPGDDLLLALAPALALAAGALVLARLVPLAQWVALRAGARSRRAVPLLAAVQARATAADLLPLVTVTVVTGLVAVVATLGVTVRAGQVDASWTTVGSEVTVTTDPDAGLTAVARDVAARPGVELAVAGRVQAGTQLRAAARGSRVTVLAVTPAEFARLLGSTPLPDAPDLDRLGPAGTDGGLPALVGPGLPVRGDGTATLLWQGQRLPVRPVGTVPGLGVDGQGTVVVDATGLSAVAEEPALPDTLWVTGPGAAAAVADTPALAGADVRDRADWLSAQRAAPLTGALTGVAIGSAATLLVLGVVVVWLGAAHSSPQRGRTLATLRTLGLTGGQARRITLGELLPPVLAAGLLGTGLGVVVAGLVRAPLELRLLTGQAEAPALVVPWAVLGGLVPLVLAVLAVVAAESSARRRERLGQVLRVG